MTFRQRYLPAAVIAMLVPIAMPAHAATITVTASAADELAANANCSLREAITNVNNGADTYAECAATGAAYGTNDTIILPAGGYAMTIAGIGDEINATGDYDINADMTITGAGADVTDINADQVDRVFHVTGAYTFNISSVKIRRGSDAGGGIYNGGGTVTVTDSIIDDCWVAPFGDGAGIYNAGGVFNLVSSTVSRNTAAVGGGVLNALGATLHISDSTITANSGKGGAIANLGTLTVTNSTISANESWDVGGGVYNVFGTATFKSTTFAENTATVAGDGILVEGGTVKVSNTLIASTNGTLAECTLDGGSLVSNGHNLDTDGSCFAAGGTDVRMGTADLGLLADNGGATQTHALRSGSDAIDAGDCVGGMTTDQRGETRPKGTACDIGAYESTFSRGGGGDSSGGGGGGAFDLWLMVLLASATPLRRRFASLRGPR